MSLFTQNTEVTLLNKLNSLQGTTNGWSAAVLKSDLLTANQNRELKSQTSHALFKELMERENIIPYFCRDNDIVFLFQGIRKYHMEELKKLICSLLPQYQPDNVILDSFFEHYVFSESHDILTEFAQYKIKRYNEEKQMVAGRKLAAQSESDSDDIGWSSELFVRALQKRSQRDCKLFLIVEDDEIMRDLARTILSQEFSVKSAESAEDALTRYNQDAPDVVFLDINMPGKNGLELLSELLERDPNACIIMFSGTKTSQMVTTALEMGAKGYVVKPFAPNALLKYAHKFAQS